MLTKPSNPSLIHANGDMATTLGLSDEDVLSSDFLNTFSGTSIYPNTKPCLVLCWTSIWDGLDNWVMAALNSLK
jgi:uncharacterized protein YdiU (UPF0061 family)